PARVKVGSYFFGLNHADGRRNQRIQRALEFIGRQRGLRPEMRHLTQGVNASVSPAGALNDDSLLRDLARSGVERALNRRHPRLELPAVETGAVVSDGELDVAHACEDYRTRESGREPHAATSGRLASRPAHRGHARASPDPFGFALL